MSTEEAKAFWARIAELEKSRGQPFDIEARFGGDAHRATPVRIVLEDDEPVAVISDELAALRDRIDTPGVTARYVEERRGELWRGAFDAARSTRRLSLNQLCRVVLGPIYFPERQVHTYNAHRELRVKASAIAPWLPQL